MKASFCFVLFILLCAPAARAQYVAIPDTNFRSWLQNQYPACMGTGPNAGMLDTTCAGVVNETSVDVSSQGIVSLEGIQYFDNLDSLDCGWNYLTSLPALPASLQFLHCIFNDLTALTALPNSLVELQCSNNHYLTALPALPNSLIVLKCTNNHLTSLPALPASLATLNCFYNDITSLPLLPASLVELTCRANQLTSLPALPASLEFLNCGLNPLTSLPALPASLVELTCRANQLTSLPALPASLNFLDCSGNNLTSLPALPASLEFLDCIINQLTSLPALPASLEDLRCHSNQLTSLPALPASLNYLDCSGNNLTALPALPASLLSLPCNHNQLTSLPALPASLKYLYCDNNPNLLCLPALPFTLESLFCSNSSITCLPNYPASLITVDPSNLPVCGPGSNPNGCSFLPHVDGTAFSDLNGNDSLTAGEPPYAGLIVMAQPGGHTASTNSSGGYQVSVDSVATYTVTIPFPPLYRTVIPTSHTGSLPGSNTFSTGNNFAIQDIPNVNDLRIDLTANTPPNPGFSRALTLAYKNIGTTAQNATVTLTYSDTIQYISATPAPTTQTGNTLTWNVGTLAPWQAGTIAVQCSTPANVALLGQVLHSFASITPVANDTTTADNYAHLPETVVGSYDPNDKQVLPEGDITTNEWLTYTVRFQNTGTAAAQTVVIRDTLDADLNIPTIQTTSASHNYVFELNGLNAAWYFNNIQLPDSNTNEPASHGFVRYRVQARHNLAVGTEVSNTASIYFDFNPPIVTNTVVNTVTQLSGFAEAGVRASLRLFPNPSTGLVTVELPSGEGQRVGAAQRIDVLDITGRVVHTAPPLQGGAGGGSATLDLQHLPAGLYTIRASTAQGVLTAKVVRQ